MSKLILDINREIDAAADDRARGVIMRRLRRALEAGGVRTSGGAAARGNKMPFEADRLD